MGGNRKFKNSKDDQGNELVSSDNESDRSTSPELSDTEMEPRNSNFSNSTENSEQQNQTLNDNANASCLITRSKRRYQKRSLPKKVTESQVTSKAELLNLKDHNSNSTDLDLNLNETNNDQSKPTEQTLNANPVSDRESIIQDILNKTIESNIGQEKSETVTTPINLILDAVNNDDEISLLEDEDDLFLEGASTGKRQKRKNRD